MTGEEILQFEDALGGVHILLRCHSRDSGLMHAHRLGDIVQHEGFHRLFAVFEKALLVLHDACCHLHKGLVATLQALDKPTCLLQVVAQIIIVGAIVSAPHQRGVTGIDANLRRGFGVELDEPAAGSAVFSHDDIGYDVTGRWRGNIRAWAWIELFDYGNGVAKLRLFEACEAH